MIQLSYYSIIYFIFLSRNDEFSYYLVNSMVWNRNKYSDACLCMENI